MEVQEKKRIEKHIWPQKGFQEQFLVSKADIVIGGGAAGSGKAEPLDSKILTPNGWVEMGNINPGNYVMCPISGNPILVTETHFHSNINMYKVSFSDGTWTECCEDHLWKVQTKKQIANGNYRIIPLKEMIEIGIKDTLNDNRFAIDCNVPLHFEEKEVKLNPYLLGLLIGDGYLPAKSSSMVCMQVALDESESLFDFIKEYIPDDVKIRLAKKYEANCRSIRFTYEIKKYLAELGLLGVKSREKFVPKSYLYNSVEVRKEVLAGLLDTDSYIKVYGKKKKTSFSTMSEQLKDDFCELVRSLGGVASVSDSDQRDKYNGGICYKISYRIPFNLFKRDRRKILFDQVGYSFHFKKKITSVEFIGKKDGQCITVDSKDHLYITRGYNMTHNSFSLLLDSLYDVNNPKFRAIYFRRKLVELDGLVDESDNLFQDVRPAPSRSALKWKFPSGATVSFSHLQYEKDKLNHQGQQYALICFDELTHFTYSQFTYLLSRNRSASGARTRVKATCNPDSDSWVAKLIDWWIGDDGYPIPERSGVIRYFLATSGKIDDLIWGDSFEEVEEKGKHILDRMMKKATEDVKTSDFIKSITFIPGTVYENKELLKVNPGYLSGLAAQDEVTKAQLLEGNWKVKQSGEEMVDSETLYEVLERYPQTNGRRAITCDVAMKGSDKMVVMAWDGFHMIDITVVNRSNGRDVIDVIQSMMKRWHIEPKHIVYDANGVGSFIDGFIPGAKEFINNALPKNKEYYANLKSQCAEKWANRMKCIFSNPKDNLTYSIDFKIANRKFGDKTLMEHLDTERRAVRLADSSEDGKTAIIKKSEMKQIIGHSPDFIETMIMLEYLYLAGSTYSGNIIF